MPYCTSGSVRPDFSIGEIVGVEVKNFIIANNSSGLISNVSKQVVDRAEHLPTGMKQQVIIDIRAQNVTEQQRMVIRSGIIAKTNGLIPVESFSFKDK